jgi:1,4-alpha-glucan branching enzyme
VAILSSAIALTAPGIPMLLAGSEFLQGGDFNDWKALDFENIEKFGGVVAAHKDIINLRKNLYGDTGGLLSNDIQILLADETAKVLIYQRGKDGEQPVIIVVNFNTEKVKDYQLPLPDGTWRARFNSSWKGYSPDFSELKITTLDSSTKLDLPTYICLILTKE